MVVAHLRQLLPKSHNFGRRSRITEDIILEALSAEGVADSLVLHVNSDLAMIPVLNQKGVRTVTESASARIRRAGELRLLDIYKVAEQLQRKHRLDNPENTVSLFQLYQLAEKSGIFEAFDEHYTVEKSTPLL